MKLGLPKRFALVIANGEDCDTVLTTSLAQKATCVIVLDGAMHRFQKMRLRADILLGDFDGNGHDTASLKALFPNLQIVHTPDQEFTDFEKGIWHAASLGFTTIIGIWATGRRADHSFSNVANLIRFPEHLHIELLDNHSRIYRIPKQFSKVFQKGDVISLVPIGTVSGIVTKNLKYPLNNETLILGIRNGSSNEALEDGLVTITYERGEMLLMECYD